MTSETKGLDSQDELL